MVSSPGPPPSPQWARHASTRDRALPGVPQLRLPAASLTEVGFPWVYFLVTLGCGLQATSLRPLLRLLDGESRWEWAKRPLTRCRVWSFAQACWTEPSGASRAYLSGTPDSHRFRDVPPPLRRPAFALPGCLQGFLVLAAYAHRPEPGYRRRRSCLQAQTAGRIGAMHNGGDVA